MNIKISHILASFLIIILLIAANVYQYQNPKVVEIPAGQAQIDSTAWVKRSALASRELIIDSLKAVNEQLAKRVDESGDKIANYTSIVGKLRLTVDSLEAEQESWNTIPFKELMLESPTVRTRLIASLRDTTIFKQKTFGNGLFSVFSYVEFRDRQFRQDFTLEQLRPIQLDVVSTFNEDHSRVLTYVTSDDFVSLQYETYTELERKNEWPTFWIGAGAGVITTMAAILIF